MKHPVTRLFLARIRALAAAQRACLPPVGPLLLAGPFHRHTLRIERGASGGFAIVAAGEAVAALLGRPIVGAPAASLFVESDRLRIESMLAEAVGDRIGCVLGAVAQRARFAATPVEAMLTPEPFMPPGGGCISACLISFSYPYPGGARALPPLALVSERYVELDGFAGSRESPPTPRGLRNGR